MPILPPALDDRSFDDLVSDLVARIPAHTPEWTNPRVGDPGRTLIDLFAWLGDTILYRANLVPERQRLVFLRMLGIPIRPALPARTVVSLSFKDDAATTSQVIRPLGRLDAANPFETLSEVTVLPVSAECYYKRIPEGDEAAQLGGIVTELQNLYQLEGEAVPYVSTPLFASGAETDSTFDVSQDSADKCLWIALLAGNADVVDSVKTALGEAESGGNQLLSVGIVPAREVPSDYADATQRGHIPHIWEMTTVESNGRAEAIGYVPLTTVTDSTNGLTRTGTVRLELPAQGIAGAPTNDVRQNYRAGVGDTPPRIDDPETAARLVSWIRLRPSPVDNNDGEVRSIPLAWVGVNCVDIDSMQTTTSRVVGQSDGSAGQQFSLPARHVDASTLILQVESSGHGYQTWQQIDHLALLSRDRTGADSAVYQLDSEAGTVRFGDGVRGRVPESGARIRVASMRAGGGSDGNLPVGTLSKISATTLDGSPVSGLVVTQPVAAAGGQAAETLAEAEQRIPAVLRHSDRAVTAEDFQQLAAETPAIALGRVEVLPQFKPQQQRPGVPGVVSVVVLPQKGTLQAPNPRPDRPMLEAVHAHLDSRRPLATELYVVGCEYVGIALSIGVEIKAGFGREEVLSNVRRTVRAWLWPLAPYGPSGAGWPLGQTVRDRELEIAVAQVDGVRGLIDPGVNLFVQVVNAETGQSHWSPVTRTLRYEPVEITLRDWQLPELLIVDVRADEPPESDAGTLHGLRGDGTNPFASASGIAVPVVPDMCS